MKKQMAAVTLQPQYDRMTKLWTKAEESIASIGLPYQVTFPLDSSGECIAWAWAKGRWRVCHGKSSSDGNNWEFCPVLDSSVDVRLRLMPFFPDLKVKVLAAVDGAATNMNRHLDNFEQDLK